MFSKKWGCIEIYRRAKGAMMGTSWQSMDINGYQWFGLREILQETMGF